MANTYINFGENLFTLNIGTQSHKGRKYVEKALSIYRNIYGD